MKKESVITISIILFILIVASVIIIIKSSNNATITKEEAECIGNNSIMYSQTGCIHCIEQEKLFGENVKYLNIIDCIQEKDKCIKLGVEATPTWVIKNQSYVGVQSIEKLKELTEC